MRLHPLQRRVLRQYLAWRDRPPTVGSLFAKTTLRVFVVGLIAVGGGLFMVWRDLSEVAYLYAGMMIGLVARDLGWYRNAVRVWPYLAGVLDWPKVERLLDEDADYEGVAGPR